MNLCAEAAACMDAGVLRDGSSRLTWRGADAYHLAFVSSFATHAVCPANAAIPVTDALPVELACLLGCGVTTGVLSVTRRANVARARRSRSSPAAASGSRRCRGRGSCPLIP